MDAEVLRGGLNALTGPDLHVLRIEDCDRDFDARRDARSRSYEYRVWNANEPNPWERRWTAHIADSLDVEAMARACAPIVGRHDFGAFYTHRAQDDVPKGTVRRILSVEWERDRGRPELLRFRITADAFLRHMVRVIVGSAVLVGAGKLPEDGLETMLQRPERSAGGPTAPASGLTLTEIAY
jgi:tRNA pseudouridine38-40 synthase